MRKCDLVKKFGAHYPAIAVVVSSSGLTIGLTMGLLQLVFLKPPFETRKQSVMSLVYGQRPGETVLSLAAISTVSPDHRPYHSMSSATKITPKTVGMLCLVLGKQTSR